MATTLASRLLYVTVIELLYKSFVQKLKCFVHSLATVLQCSLAFFPSYSVCLFRMCSYVCVFLKCSFSWLLAFKLFLWFHEIRCFAKMISRLCDSNITTLKISFSSFDAANASIREQSSERSIKCRALLQITRLFFYRSHS